MTAGAPVAGSLGWDEGVFLVDKPVGRTSFAMVRRIRWLLRIRKVGHAGTLDPFATGLLIVCAGRPATRHIERFMDGRKVYQARLQLGVETLTQDSEGPVVRTAPVPALDETAISAVLRAHQGPQLQVPPAYSAVKHQGRPLYSYARQGVYIRKEAREIEIGAIRFDGYDDKLHQLDLTVTCGKGTYVRVLAADIGASLGCGAHLIGLRRIASGPFRVEEALAGEELLTDRGLELLLRYRRGITETLALLDPAAL
ncbi:MAG: tRNA pseudouridine(55) synthase TruB [Desulfobulbus sp.]|jgi:tRNA pseudouridine55 synthase